MVQIPSGWSSPLPSDRPPVRPSTAQGKHTALMGPDLAWEPIVPERYGGIGLGNSQFPPYPAP